MAREDDIGRVVSILSNQIKRHIDRNSAEDGLTGVQGRVLHFILARSGQGEVFQRDIEEEFNLRRSTATGILQLMEKNGMIRRESVAYDARLKSLIPTEKAAGLKERVEAGLAKIEALLKKGVSEEELQTFYKVTEQMSKNLDE